MKVQQRVWDADAIEAMRPVLDVSPWAGIVGMGDEFNNTHLWEFSSGPRSALLAVRGLQFEGGRVLDVIGLRSLGDRLQADELVAALETVVCEAYGNIDLLSMATRRDHVLRACERHGWTAVARVATKHLKVH